MKKFKNKNIKKIKKNIAFGKAYIRASYNNTLFYITDPEGNVLLWKTAGSEGFKGSKKSTPHAAQMTSRNIAKTARDNYGISSIEIYISGPGSGREAAIRGFANILKVTYIADITSIPHNGCKPAKERRI